MTLRHILLVNPNTDRRVTGWLAAEARRVAGPDLTVEAINAASGLAAIETPAHVAQAASAVLDAIRRRPNIDGAVVAAFGDPGLAEARAACAIPVAGLGEAGLKAAGQNSRRFAIVTLGAAMEAAIGTRVESLGLVRQCAGITVLPVAIGDFVADRDRYRPLIEAAVRDFNRDGIATVLLGGAPFAGVADRLVEKLGCPVIDGVVASLQALSCASR